MLRLLRDSCGLSGLAQPLAQFRSGRLLSLSKPIDRGFTDGFVRAHVPIPVEQGFEAFYLSFILAHACNIVGLGALAKGVGGFRGAT